MAAPVLAQGAMSPIGRLAAWPQDDAPPPATVQGTAAAAANGDDDAALKIVVDDLTNVDAIGKQLETIAADAGLATEMKERLTKPLNQAIKLLRQRQTDADRAATFEKSLSTVSTDTARARGRVDRQPAAAPDPPDFGLMSLERLREGKAQSDAATEAARQDLMRITNEISQRQPRRESLPKLIADARQTVERLQGQTIGEIVDDPGGLLAAAIAVERRAEITAAKQTVETLEKELKLIEAESELLPLRKIIAAAELAAAEKLNQAWSDAVRQSRQSAIESDLRSYREELGSAAAADSSRVLQERQRWIDLVARTERLNRRLKVERDRTTEWSRVLREKEQTIKDDLKLRRAIRPSLGMELQLLQSKLPQRNEINQEIDDISAELESLQAEQTKLQMVLETAGGGLVDGIPIAVDDQLPMKDGKLHPTEKRLLERFIADSNDNASRLIQVQQELESQRGVLMDLRELIDSNVLWIRNRPRFSLDDLWLSWSSLSTIMHPATLKRLFLQCWRGMMAQPPLLALLAVSLATMIFAGSRLRRRLTDLAAQASHRSQLSLRPTFSAIMITVALAVPLSVLLFVLGKAIESGPEPDSLMMQFAAGLILAATAVLPLELMRQIFRPRGLAVAHFGADEAAVAPLRTGLRVLLDLGVPLLILWRVSQGLGRAQVDASLGRVLFAIGMVSVAVMLWQSMHPQTGLLSARLRMNPQGWWSRLRGLWFAMLIAAPLVLAGICLAGYMYAATALVGRVYGTLWLVVITYVIRGLLWRWLLTQRRRLAIAVHRAELEEAERLGMGGFEIETDKPLAAAEINAQTSRLFNALITTSVLIGVALVWSPVLPAVQFLESFELWDTVKTRDASGNPIEVDHVTLANLVLAIPIVILTWIAVRNLPGLIEVFLLERLPIEKPARYAITTLGTYVLTGIGLIWGAQTLGLRWDSIQWLVAALGVGLGFGLQEIFANFVSGLILLFEQPIRVGDVVTLNDTTGVVSRIRIRATTVTNWDRQELIVPNKDLITGRLVNWTLSDTTNRIIINVGIAYGSNTRAACEVLEQICRDHPNIVNEPPPIVTFEGFGESTLKLVIRCFLSSLDVRLLTIHELHTAINERFAAAGIEIAFPQRDLHIRSWPGGVSFPDLTAAQNGSAANGSASNGSASNGSAANGSA